MLVYGLYNIIVDINCVEFVGSIFGVVVDDVYIFLGYNFVIDSGA